MQQQVVGGGTPSAGGAQQHQRPGSGGVRPSAPLDVGPNSRPALRPGEATVTEVTGPAQLPRQQQVSQQQQMSQQQQQQISQQQQQQMSQQQQQQMSQQQQISQHQQISQQQQISHQQQQISQQQLSQSSLAAPSSQQIPPASDPRLPQPPSPGGASLPQPLATSSAPGRGGAGGSGGQPQSPRVTHHQHHLQQSDLGSRGSGACRAGPGPGIAGGGTPSTRFMRPPPPPVAVCGGGSSSGSGGMPLVAVSTAPQAVLMPRPPPPPPPPPPVLCSRPPPPFPHPPSLLHHHHPHHHHHHHQGPPPPPPHHHLQQRLMESQLPPPFYDDDDDFGAMQRGGRRSHGTLRITKWVNPIPFDPDDGQQQVGEQELATKMLQIQSKRFYIDVKQNRRGRFMKVAEIGADGRRNQVFLALSTAAEFREHLTQFSDFYSNLGPPNPDTLPEDGKLKSETMVKDNRRYYLDLKENSRGRFLRVSQTIARGGPRCQIAIPAQGMIEFRDALQELLDEFGTDDGGFKGELPEGRHMRVENKNFYFDIGQNNRGIYMRISEVKTNFRTAITIPEKSWSRFRDIFSDYVDKMKEGGDKEKAAPPSGESSESSPNK